VATAAQHHTTFLEISPHPLLTHAITETLTTGHHHSLGTLQRDGDDTVTFHTNLDATHTTQPPSTPHPPGPHPAIPSTPWQHGRHWICIEEPVGATSSAPRPGTLLGEHIAVTTTQAHLWQARLAPETKPYPGRHSVGGVELVPISVLLETFSAAALECGASPVLTDVRLEHPIVVDQPRLVQVLTDGQSVTVSSTPAADKPLRRWVRHATARLAQPSAVARPEGVVRTNGHEKNGHEPSPVDLSSVAELQRAWGIEGQPYAWSVVSCRPVPGGLSADVTLPGTSTVALVDAAVHLARLVDATNPRLMFPADVGSVWFHGDLTEARGQIEVRYRGGGPDDLIVDIAVKAPDGSTCVDIRSLRFTDVESTPAAAARDTDPSAFAHAIEWQPWDQPADARRTPDAPSALAVVGSGESVHVLRDRLTAAGYSESGIDDARYVLYLAEPDTDDITETDMDGAVRMSTEVGDLVRRLTERDDDHPVTLWIMTTGVREAISDSALPQSCLWGIAGVIGAEQPQLWGGLVDLPAGTDVGESAVALATLLPTSARSVMALRENELSTPVFVPVASAPVREPLRCRPDVAYLITGGMGALGLLIADWLVDRGARRLVLAGRSPLPPRRQWGGEIHDPDVRRKIAAIRALEMRGVCVDAVAVDVGSGEAMQKLLATRDRDGDPPIRGVIHAAGVTESQLLTEIDEDRLRRALWPKVEGARVLDEAFPPGTLDFFYMTASAGAVFGVPGQGAYAAANAYLDGLARARHHRGCNTVSLDWVAWQGLGFASDAEIVVQELLRIGSRPVTPEEAFAAWEHVSRHELAQAVMAPLPSPGGTAETAEHHTSQPKWAWSEMSAEAVLSTLEVELRVILACELGMADDDLELDRPFADMGLNSVMAMSVRRAAEQLIGIELSATMLWNHPTIAALAAYLTNKLLPRDGSATDVGNHFEGLPDSAGSVLDALFDSVDPATAGSESGS
jgi:phthiocerol/phenolphthiocerol synthesis type-I polyketide synthase A